MEGPYKFLFCWPFWFTFPVESQKSIGMFSLSLSLWCLSHSLTGCVCLIWMSWAELIKLFSFTFSFLLLLSFGRRICLEKSACSEIFALFDWEIKLGGGGSELNSSSACWLPSLSLHLFKNPLIILCTSLLCFSLLFAYVFFFFLFPNQNLTANGLMNPQSTRQHFVQ